MWGIEFFRTSAHSVPARSGPNIYLFSKYKYTVAAFRRTRRGCQISLQMVVRHHVDCWDLNSGPSEEQSVLLPAEPSHQPCLFYLYEYTVAIFKHTRRGHHIPFQVVVSHHVGVEPRTSALEEQSVLLTAETSLQPHFF